jgi:hypothetical protein
MNNEQITKAINDWALLHSKSILNRLHTGSAQRTPVDTGTAKNGWKIQNDINILGETGVIINQVPYIGWLEFGTTKMQPNYMVTTTIAEVKRDYP